MDQQLVGNIITGVLTLIGSGILVFIVNRRKAITEDKRSGEESNRKDFGVVTQLLQTDNERLRAEIVEMKKQIAKLQTELSEVHNKYRREIDSLKSRIREEERKGDDLANKLNLFETSHHDLPLPSWLKDLNGIMLSLNDAYEELFLLPQGKTRSDYVGHTDIDVWGEEIGKHYQANDRRVHVRKKSQSFVEKIIVDDNNMTEDFIVLKYPRFVGRTLIGIGGICFPVDYYNDLRRKKSSHNKGED